MKKIICGAVIASISLMSSLPVFAYDLPEKSISVSGRGVISAEPDTAEISFGIVTSGTDAAKAQEENNRIYKEVCQSLTDAGIKEEDIKSTWYYVYTERNYENNEVTGYRVENNFSVKTNDKDNAGKYIDSAVKAGVTEVHGVSFSVENPQEYYDKALQAAILNAQNSAETIKKSIGAENITVYSIEEQSSRYSYSTANTVYEEKASADYSSGSSSAMPTDITYDDIEITANVNAVYKFN